MLHEFAHQLDQEDGAADGAPLRQRAEPGGGGHGLARSLPHSAGLEVCCK
ncbi:zinc-dependent peptidase [Mangrovimicrobium sediminis]